MPNNRDALSLRQISSARVECWVSLLKIPSGPEFERLRGIYIELIRSGEAGCNPKVKAIGPGSRSKNVRYMDPQTAA
jgi:hypothetical protein